MAKILKYDNEAKQLILDGINKLEKAVSSTLGPSGKTVIIENNGRFYATKDGVTVARSISLENQFENIGASALKQISENSNTIGDGTTSTCVVGASIYRNGLKYVSLGNANATQIRNGIKKAADAVVDYIKNVAKPIVTKDDIKKVALVSSNYDEEIAETIANVMAELGKDGVVRVENGQTTSINSKIETGLVIDRPYASPYLVTNQERLEAELSDPQILIVNKKLTNIQDMLPCLLSVTDAGRSLLIIADDIDEAVLSTLIFNKLKGCPILAIKSPSYGDSRKLILEDIAIATGGKVVSDDTGITLEQAFMGSGVLGTCKTVVANRENTVIMGGAGNKDEVEARASAIRAQAEGANDYDAQKLMERAAKLTSGIGVILCGGLTESEAKERKDRIDDAVAAAKSALKGGVVAGGGSALLMARKHFDDWANKKMFGELYGDEGVGITIVMNSLEAPIRTILKNADIDAGTIIDKLYDCTDEYGYNVLSKKIENLIESGIYDSAEVVISEISNAASIASILLTSDCVICEKKEPVQSQLQQMPMM